MGDSRVPKHAELLLRAQRAKQQEWHAPETDPARITRAGGTVPIKTHGGVRSWVLIYKLGLAKMPNHEYTVNTPKFKINSFTVHLYCRICHTLTRSHLHQIE